MRKKLLVGFAAGLFLVCIAGMANADAVLHEDFEDGDITNNPVWYIDIDQGAYDIVIDPNRTGNLVYKVHGTSSGNRNIYSNLDNNISWEDFDLTFEFMASDWGFHPQWYIATANHDYSIGFGLWLDPSWETIKFYPMEDSTRILQDSVELQKDTFSLNTWYKLHTYYNAQSGNVITELRVLETDVLITSISYLPAADLSEIAPAETLWLGAEEIYWQYFDNIELNSTPTTPPCPEDTMAPSGSVHAYPNLIWPPNNKMVTVTLAGRVMDEISIAKEGSGHGVSSAYLLIDGTDKIILLDEVTDLLDSDGYFSVEVEVKASKGAEYLIELFATDNNPGIPNSGLVDTTYIRVPNDMSSNN